MCAGSLREWCTSDKTLSLINDAVVDLVELHVENGLNVCNTGDHSQPSFDRPPNHPRQIHIRHQKTRVSDGMERELAGRWSISEQMVRLTVLFFLCIFRTAFSKVNRSHVLLRVENLIGDVGSKQRSRPFAPACWCVGLAPLAWRARAPPALVCIRARGHLGCRTEQAD